MATFTVSDPLTLRVLAYIAGQAEPAWMVGGFVRDRLLDRPDHDLDLVVPTGGIDLARAIAHAFASPFFVLDAERDVARALVRAEPEPLTVDVAGLRAPELWRDLALRDFTINAMAAPVNLVPGSQPVAWQLVDPMEGLADLQLRVLRAVSSEAFRDDPLRTLRGVRLAVELGFHLEATTAELIRRDAHLLARVAAERIRDELLRIIDAPGAWQHLRLLAGLDLLRPILPEAQALIGVTQSEPHYLDVFDHTRAVMAHAEGILALLWPGGPWTTPAGLAQAAAAPTPPSLPAAALSAVEPDLSPEGAPALPAGAVERVVIAPEWQWAALAETLAPFRDALCQHLSQPLASGRVRRDWFLWAALAHDWGKAPTRTVGSDWRIHFYDHEHQGALLAEERLRLLACAANESAYVGLLVDQHMRPAHLARHYPPSSRALYRFFRDTGQSGPDVVLLSLADKLATRGPHAEADRAFWQDLLAVARQVFAAYFEAHAERVNPAPLLDGRAVMAELSLDPGPQVGRLLEGLREAQAVGEVTTIDEARAWLHHAASQE